MFFTAVISRDAMFLQEQRIIKLFFRIIPKSVSTENYAFGDVLEQPNSARQPPTIHAGFSFRPIDHVGSFSAALVFLLRTLCLRLLRRPHSHSLSISKLKVDRGQAD